MADDSSSGGKQKNKPFPKTFGDVMKGIPAGQGGEPKRVKAEGALEKPTGGDRRGDKRKRPDEVKKGPVVVRKPAPLTAKKEEATPSDTEASAAPGAVPAVTPEVLRAAPIEPPRKAPKTVFRRADGLNLPPREAEVLAPAEPEGPEENFAEMFAASSATSTPKRFDVGQKVAGRVVQIGQEQAFLDLGGKGEAMIDLAELRDSQGDVIVAVGEVIEGYILTTGGGIVVTKQLSKGATRDFLVEARAGGIPVEGLVAGHNKGGLEIDLGAGTRGFCPASQVDVRRVEDLGSLVGQRFSFKVIELKDTDVVLSRRAFLEAESAKKGVETREKLFVGAQLEGVVTSVRDFGAFVDLGGIEGMIHVSELGYSRVAHPKDVLTAGQKVMVEVVKIEPGKPGDRERIGLSMKALQTDPWQQAASQLKEGDRIKGKVVRLQPFGAFVEILPGVDGLVHISALGAPKRIAHPSEVVAEGDEIECVVEGIDPMARRIALRRITGDEPAPVEGKAAREVKVVGPPKVGDLVEATVDKVEPFGLFVRFPNGRGLIPNVEMGTPKGADHRKLFPPGTVFKAAIIEVDGTGRLKLSKAGAEQAQERAEYREFMQEHQKKAPGGKGFGTLGEMLKNFKK